MNPGAMLTKVFEWVETRLDEGAWFRRSYLILAMWMNARTLLWAMEFATNSTRPGLELAAIVGAIAAIPGAVMAHAFQVYLTSRGGT